MEPALDADIAAVLDLTPEASPEEIAARFATLAGLPQPSRTETVRCLAETVRSAESLWELHGQSCAEFATFLESKTDKVVTLEEADVAAAELNMSSSDVLWSLAEHMWSLLVAAGSE